MRAITADGSELVLHHRDGIYQIRIDGRELVSSRAHGSEEALAHLACDALRGADAPRVLIGGLGMGYTLRAALDALPEDATVVVAEVLDVVLAWNQGPLAHLAGRPLDDRRVTVVTGDVAALLERTTEPFGAILLDVDNGPSNLALPSNRHLYTVSGLTRMRRSLTRGGILAVWSPYREPGFVERLRLARFSVRVEEVAPRPGTERVRHRVFLACPEAAQAGIGIGNDV